VNNSNTAADACRTTCAPAACGDGVKDSGEVCDNGVNNSDTTADACRSTCVAAACGDKVVDSGETCDDGNTTAGDGCSATCQTEAPAAVCGNSKIETGETCDDGNTTAGDGCSDTCQTEAPAPVCGNSKVETGETCDDGNTTAGDGCSATCQTEAAPPTSGHLVLNEVDYDMPQVAEDREYIELYNGTGAAIDLSGMQLFLVNGNTNSSYKTVALDGAGASLANDAYLVLGNTGVQAGLPNGTLFIDLGASNVVQNGNPDGIIVLAADGSVVDALSYEGSITAATLAGHAGKTFNLVEGTPATAGDTNAAGEEGGLCRVKNGVDTDDAATDWAFCTALTPGLPN